MGDRRHIVVGITGASGAPLAIELLKSLQKKPGIETHLIVSESGRLTIEHETGHTLADVGQFADYVYAINDMSAIISSGTFKTDGMIIVPCSMKTLAGINHGYSDNLIQRAADVTIKEGRKLLLIPRETPLSAIHLKNMYELSRLGVSILPPMLGYYNRPETISDATAHIVGKILDSFGISYTNFKRWNKTT